MTYNPPRDHDPAAGSPELERGSSEADYLQRLTQEKTPVAVHLRTGEIFRGYIEYYDQRFIRLTQEKAPNLFIFKQDIKYFCEE